MNANKGSPSNSHSVTSKILFNVSLQYISLLNTSLIREPHRRVLMSASSINTTEHGSSVVPPSGRWRLLHIGVADLLIAKRLTVLVTSDVRGDTKRLIAKFSGTGKGKSELYLASQGFKSEKFKSFGKDYPFSRLLQTVDKFRDIAQAQNVQPGYSFLDAAGNISTLIDPRTWLFCPLDSDQNPYTITFSEVTRNEAARLQSGPPTERDTGVSAVTHLSPASAQQRTNDEAVSVHDQVSEPTDTISEPADEPGGKDSDYLDDGPGEDDDDFLEDSDGLSSDEASGEAEDEDKEDLKRSRRLTRTAQGKRKRSLVSSPTDSESSLPSGHDVIVRGSRGDTDHSDSELSDPPESPYNPA
ncbi:hypothetical protein BD324DRAFT_631088 [Kockovaella imperatae]|uniref:Uncharacterized protein n=1 Tax=Kockovaella imperatae TaxID=4999 RepID=A0A1Y1UDP2_9TREE|nr:hypothetical protein BD324DRAFT_631088 [Kockovaella imperatae]ORX35667.1 hypothetical protein BD324DRAFT_631088 [Kockovaella imperatae]